VHAVDQAISPEEGLSQSSVEKREEEKRKEEKRREELGLQEVLGPGE
jgi:hypothetical protein